MAEKNNFEAELKNLQEIVNNLEKGKIPLDEALDQFKAGIELSRKLDKELTKAQETVAHLINEQGQSSPMDALDRNAPEEK
ncbi:MAG: exodeoxyribonuclease VII small subunit [Lactobacillus sp.]|nr:exodeoxyribonuclease VII small subunit [Lactobacillus sp.]